MITNCTCCGKRNLIGTYASLIRCRDCGHICADISLSDRDIERLYSSDYFRGKEYGDYVADKHVLQRNFIARLRDMERHLSDLNELSLLEVGCAYGFFLELAQTRFREARGIDLSKDVIAYAREKLRVDARQANFLTLSRSEDATDVICMWDTIEHLRQPEAFVAQASRLLQPGGHLFLTTGDVGSLNARVRGGRWRLIHPPTHLHYFCRGSITALLRRNLFEIIDFRHVGFYRSVANTFANLLREVRPNAATRLLSSLRGSYYLNLYDIMFVVARRKPS